ncbi:hypothetical protein ALI144C_20810 [Actinosynnema sp. ALI-1.44]|nr:hypothetical protein ALI144C_20810 [Actinosynnema sp. ALI-1.44]
MLDIAALQFEIDHRSQSVDASTWVVGDRQRLLCVLVGGVEVANAAQGFAEFRFDETRLNVAGFGRFFLEVNPCR